MLTSPLSLHQTQPLKLEEQRLDLSQSLYLTSADSGKSSFYQPLLSMSSGPPLPPPPSTRQQFTAAEARVHDVADASMVCQASGFIHHRQSSILDVIISSPQQLSTAGEPHEPLKMEMKEEMEDVGWYTAVYIVSEVFSKK